MDKILYHSWSDQTKKYRKHTLSIILNCQNLSKSFSSENLFTDLSFSVNEGELIGIIGPNGSGKSTLLKIINQSIDPDEGKVVLRKGVQISYVAQDTGFDEGSTVYNVLKESALQKKHSSSDIDAIVNITMGKAQFYDPDQKVETLSGGWRKRLSIACGLVQEPDLLLLDEPTNHLDIDSILWLEQTIKNYNKTCILISHDRYFLEKTVSRVAEINTCYEHNILFSEGSYNNFITTRLKLMNDQAKTQETMSNKLRREEEWLSRGPKARSTKAKFRIDAASKLKQDLSEVRSRLKTEETQISFSESSRKSKKLLAIEQVSKSFDSKTLLKNLDLTITSKTKIGILGRNGSGKTTLIKLINRSLKPDSGEIKAIDGLKTVYFDQKREFLDEEMLLKRALSETGDHVIYRDKPVHIATWAKKFLFSHEQLNSQVKKLSGGEKAKIHLANMMLKPCDLLILDEPTNDLDIQTMETLEESLSSFNGAIILVSHDRYMLEKVCNQFLALDGKGQATLYADYKQWQKTLKPKAKKEKASNKNASTTQPQPKTSKKLSYKDQREYDLMEEKILKLEEDLDLYQKESENPDIISNSKKLNEIFAKLEATQNSLDESYKRWTELENIQK